MKIIVYADESGTHDRTFKLDGSHVPVVSGYMAYRSDWIKFCADWKTVLDKYDVPYFHYSELANNKKETSFYYKWDASRRNNFIYDLAEIAGRQIPIGGAFNLEALTESNKNSKKYEYEFCYVFEQFFADLLVAIKEHFPDLTSDIDLFFDQKKDDAEWESWLNKIAGDFRKKDKRIGAIAFADKKKCPHWPLQAADMIAYRTRRVADKAHETIRDSSGKIIGATKALQNANLLDVILNRNLRPGGFKPIISQELLSECAEFSPKYPSIMRALFEEPKTKMNK